MLSEMSIRKVYYAIWKIKKKKIIIKRKSILPRLYFHVFTVAARRSAEEIEYSFFFSRVFVSSHLGCSYKTKGRKRVKDKVRTTIVYGNLDKAKQ